MTFMCVLCSNTYKYSSETEHHIRSVHLKTTKWKCHKCEQFFTGKAALKKHIKICRPKTIVKRKRKRFAILIDDENSISKYIVSTDQGKKGRKFFPCNKCGIKLNSYLNLMNHYHICESQAAMTQNLTGFSPSPSNETVLVKNECEKFQDFEETQTQTMLTDQEHVQIDATEENDRFLSASKTFADKSTDTDDLVEIEVIDLDFSSDTDSCCSLKLFECPTYL